MRIYLSILAMLVTCVAVASEPELLIRIDYRGYYGPGGFDIRPPLPTHDYSLSALSVQSPDIYSFSAYSNGLSARMEFPIESEHIGHTFFADELLLSEFDEVLTRSDNVGFTAENGSAFSVPYIFDLEGIFLGRYNDPSLLIATAFVSPTVPSLSHYSIDALTMTVDTSQVIDIFGHAVPEPASCFLLFVTIPFIICRKRARYPSLLKPQQSPD